MPPVSGPKFSPGLETARNLRAKNRLSRPAPMHFRERLKTESVILTPPHDIQLSIVIFTLLKSYLEKANAGVAAGVAAGCSRDWNRKGSRNNKE